MKTRPMERVLVTGATGFVGRRLVQALLARGLQVRAAVREPSRLVIEGVETAGYDLSGAVDPGILRGIDTLYHLAARVHQFEHASDREDSGYRRSNVDATTDLARAAVAARCRRLVFVSSIKVNGEATTGTPFDNDDPPRPEDAYARSKWDAERGLAEIAGQSGLEVVVLRPPLVYGPGVGANFLRLLRLVERGLPLPLGSVRNRRSLIYVDNLVDALLLCGEATDAAGKTFLISDGVAVSTAELVRLMATALGRRARLWPVPVAVLAASAALFGRGHEMGRLTGSLEVDDSAIRMGLGWRPPYTLREGLDLTARWLRGLER